MISIGERPIGPEDIRAALHGPITVPLSDRARGLIASFSPVSAALRRSP